MSAVALSGAAGDGLEGADLVGVSLTASDKWAGTGVQRCNWCFQRELEAAPLLEINSVTCIDSL